ncbi:unnamed protein product [Bursaphelenchus xylophilus]|uniref:(pine wood nematode) hypothetical protein n=1 Tax=Bursaphelenchus xylophilus TaxID=6326 RepID=A0A1I7S410_BURXY|nr:unnamed protein product [Bursaphelenchus xylophilus]CAG9116614.1 unnamed protein product [Bursaphelenchus xylophilus]
MVLIVPAGSVPKQRRTVREFIDKYFLHGQHLDEDLQSRLQSSPDLPFHEKYRKYIAFISPILFWQLTWWPVALTHGLLGLYSTRWEMAVTMIFGALVAGATSEGGGAIAFPVMTLLLHIQPTVARDFSLMIQSAGMAASSFTVIYMRIKVEWHSIIFSSLGAAFSIIISLQFMDDLLTPLQKKMMFVSIWFSFAIALFILNRQRKRRTYDVIPHFNFWKGAVLFVTGLFGGVLSAYTGSGVDICSFSVLTLFFHISEKVATPTSVVLMFLNTCVGFYWRQLIQNNVSDLAWEYFAVCIPVVVIFSPVGAFLSSHLHRQVLAATVYILETVALFGFLITQPPIGIIIAGGIIILIASGFFFVLGWAGQRLGDQIESAINQSPHSKSPVVP